MASVGPQSPATASGWTSSTNVFVSDDSRATDSIPFGQIGLQLSVTNFDFSAIPEGSTLDGFFMEYERSFQGLGMAKDYEIILTGVTGTSENKADTGEWGGNRCLCGSRRKQRQMGHYAHPC